MLVASLALAAACGGDDDSAAPTDDTTDATDEDAAPTDTPDEPETPDEPDTTDAADPPAGAAPDLSAVCPDPLVLQTDWFPSPEHGYAYRLIGDAGTLDAENGIFSGPLLDTGIDLEIRAGGPYLGFQPTPATMYLDDDIHLGYVNTDDKVATADGQPTIGVMAPLEINPQILMWNPEAYDFETFEDIGESDAAVLVFGGSVYVDYLVNAGFVRPDQVDPSYDGAPARFVAEDGALAQQGFATSEPYRYEVELEDWGRPVEFLLIHDSGYEIYSQTLSVRTDALDELSPCLEQVVPVFQQAVVDHWTDPEPTNQLIVEIVDDLDSSWVLAPGQMEYSARTAVELGVVGNGSDDTVGNFDDDRMERMVELVVDVLGIDDVSPDAVYTNRFIDPSIGF